MASSKITRREFLGATVAVAGTMSIVPSHVLGRPGKAAPSDTVNYAVIGNGSRRDRGIGCLGARKRVAVCDVDTGPKHLGGQPDNKTRYTDYRLMLERKDIDVVAIGTPPHWHALPCIHAAQAGKDIFCEKPMTKFIAEGRAVADAVERYGVVFQIGTFKRFGAAGKQSNVENHKIIANGLMKDLSGTVVTAGAKNRTGQTNLGPQKVPDCLDYDMWLGPAPYKPYNSKRVHYSNRFYWDYEGGDLTNFGFHSLDPVQWIFAKDHTSPVKIVPNAPWPQHPDAVCPFGWVELTYADGLKIVITGGKSGAKYSGPKTRGSVKASDLDDAGRKRLAKLPDPPKLVTFGEAVRTRQRAGGHAESSHRVSTALNLANIAIRMGRTIKYDPVAEQIIGDEEANRLVNIPTRGPWRI
jgi:myo-inositol 2-dehydrogenase / D-chiro-inositol 1-dehydrogenase